MEIKPPASPGFLGSFRVLGDSLLAGVQDRLSLLSLELQEEKFRLIRIFLWISAAVFAGVMAVAFASLALVYLFWESARLAVLSGLALFYTLAFVAILVALRSFLAHQPRPFAATLEELDTDRSCMRNGN
jgi:uncharacterized membrane protein YqjE